MLGDDSAEMPSMRSRYAMWPVRPSRGDVLRKMEVLRALLYTPAWYSHEGA
jgi:hypothetical protein